MLGIIQSGRATPASGRGSPRRRRWLVSACVLAGGIALGAIVSNSTQVELTTSSIPPGIVSSSGFHDVGSDVSVMPPPLAADGYRFI